MTFADWVLVFIGAMIFINFVRGVILVGADNRKYSNPEVLFISVLSAIIVAVELWAIAVHISFRF